MPYARCSAASLRDMLSILISFIPECQTEEHNARCEQFFLLVIALLEKVSSDLGDMSQGDKRKVAGLAKAVFSAKAKIPEFSVSKDCSAHQSLSKLTMWLCGRIMKRGTVEERRNELLVDEYLVGLMSIVSGLLQKLGEVLKKAVGKVGLVKHIFVSCLFEIPTETDHSKLAPPKCKSGKR